MQTSTQILLGCQQASEWVETPLAQLNVVQRSLEVEPDQSSYIET